MAAIMSRNTTKVLHMKTRKLKGNTLKDCFILFITFILSSNAVPIFPTKEIPLETKMLIKENTTLAENSNRNNLDLSKSNTLVSKNAETFFNLEIRNNENLSINLSTEGNVNNTKNKLSNIIELTDSLVAHNLTDTFLANDNLDQIIDSTTEFLINVSPIMKSTTPNVEEFNLINNTEIQNSSSIPSVTDVIQSTVTTITEIVENTPENRIEDFLLIDVVNVSSKTSKENSFQIPEELLDVSNNTNSISKIFDVEPDEKLKDSLTKNANDDSFFDSVDKFSNANEKSTEKILETDSDEFFIPEDIKEREVTKLYDKTDTLAELLDGNNLNNNFTKIKPFQVKHDAETVFYISNTDLKVIESAPTSNSNGESQMYPAIYEEDVFVDISPKNSSSVDSDKYEEDIILSPLKPNFDLNEFNDEGISIRYIGESFIDVKESTDQFRLSNHENDDLVSMNSNVIIQPVHIVLPSPETTLTIGVPVIGAFNQPPDVEQVNENFVDNFRKKEFIGDFSKEIIEYEKSIPMKRNGKPEMLFQNSTSASVINATNFLDMNESSESFLGFNDMQTIILACFATLIPLTLCVVITFGVRYLWRKYRHNHGLVCDNSTDALAVKSRVMSVDELKSSESGYTINRSNDTLESCSEYVGSTNRTNHSEINGSVIIMTLKNNHLIVETEERNDMARDTRETKVHYSPSEKYGVFVVEAARGADSRNLCNGHSDKLHSDVETKNLCEYKKHTPNIDSTLLYNKEIQIHPIPDSIARHDSVAKETESFQQPCFGNSNTGLSQSDLSITSSCYSNRGYCYGNQQSYTINTKEYQSAFPYSNDNYSQLKGINTDKKEMDPVNADTGSQHIDNGDAITVNDNHTNQYIAPLEDSFDCLPSPLQPEIIIDNVANES